MPTLTIFVEHGVMAHIPMKTLELYRNHSQTALSFSRSDWQESFLEELHRSADDSFN